MNQRDQGRRVSDRRTGRVRLGGTLTAVASGLAIAIGAGCASKDDSGSATGVSGGALTLSPDSARVLGWEDPTDWSPLFSSSGDHVQGDYSLAVSASGWTELVSVPLAGVGDVEDTVSLDVQLPAAVSWGEIRIVLQLPSASEYWRDLGGVSLVGVQSGEFTTLSWPIDSGLRAKLEGNYSDLTIRVQLNAPGGEYLLDALRFGSQGGALPSLADDGGEFGFANKSYWYGYIYPRSYPELDANLVAANRREAIADLRSQRAASGYVHVGEEGISGSSSIPDPGCTQGDCPVGYCQLCVGPTGGTSGECTCQPAGTGGSTGTGGSSATGGSAATGGSGGTSGTGGTGTGGTTSSPCGWSHAGPTNVPGRVISVSIDPANHNVMYVGTVGGLYQSKDKGRRWRRVSDNLFTDRAGTVAVWGAEVLVGPGDPDLGVPAGPRLLEPVVPGIWKYEDGMPGTWTQVTPGTTGSGDPLVALEIVFANANTVYAGTNDGVWEGTLSGGTWSFSQHGLAGLRIRDIAVGSTTPLVLYAAEARDNLVGVWKFQSGAWSLRNSGLPGSVTPTGKNHQPQIALAADGQTLYTRVTTPLSNSFDPERLFKTTTAAETPPGGGDAWFEITDVPVQNPDNLQSGRGHYYSVLEVDPSDANHLYWGAVTLWGGNVSGTSANWSNISCGSTTNCPAREKQRIHDDQHTLTFDLDDPTVIWAGTDGGLFRSTPPASDGTWEWAFAAHGIRSSEVYSVAAGTGNAGLVSGGFQDQGSQMTFGNRTWYPIDGADGRYVAVDAENPLTILGSNQFHNLFMTLEPVPYVSLSQSAELRAWGHIGFWRVDGILADGTTSATVPSPPFATDPTTAGMAFAVNRPPVNDPTTGDFKGVDTSSLPLGLIRTDDGVDWSTVLDSTSTLLGGGRFLIEPGFNWPGGRHSIVVSPSLNSAGRKSVYVWTSTGTILMNHEDGDAYRWNTMPPLTGASRVMALAVDPTNALRVLAVTQTGQLFRFGDSLLWSEVVTSASSPVNPVPSIPMAAVAIDPVDPDQFYVASDTGVFHGTFLADGTASWEEFNQGMPDNAPVTDIWLNPVTHTLHVATFGFGVYHYDLDREPICDPERLLVRDNVFDYGQDLSPFGEPDPEHPVVDSQRNATILDATRFSFFKPNDDVGGRVYWWDSTDIRVDTPDAAPEKNQIDYADNYEFESCPIEVSECFPGTMVDSGLQRPPPNDPSLPYYDVNVYVQAIQLGLGEVPDVRAAVLVTDATVEVPPLPAEFWTQTFPERTSAGPAGALCGAGFDETATDWRLVGCEPFEHPIAAGVPEVKQFDWRVFPTDPDHQCMLAVVDSFGDGIEDSARDGTWGERVEDVVQRSRHIAQRNLYVINPPSDVAVPPGGGIHSGPYADLTWIWVPNYTADAVEKDILLSTSGMAGGRLSFLLPEGMDEVVPELPRPCGQPPAPGNEVGVITLPRGLTEGVVALGATHRLWLGDRASIEEPSGAFSSVANAGSNGTEIGASAVVGSVTSVASVFLRSNATVTGDVTTEGSISKQNDVTVGGTETSSADLSPATSITWPAPATGPFGGDVSLEPTDTRTITPGTYGKLSVKTGATLTLEGGEYRFSSIEALEPGSVVAANTEQQPVIIYVEGSVIVRGSIEDTAGDGSGVMIVMLCAGWATLESPFRGTMLAPNGTINLGTAGGQPHLGSFFGREVAVAADAIVRRVRFAGFDTIGACAPLTDDEAVKAVGLGLDPDAVYPLGTTERHVRILLAGNTRMKLGLRYEAGVAQVNTAERFRVVSMDGATVLGGSTFVLRH